jgi:heat shock protein HslJ
MCDDKAMKVERELLIALEEVEFIKKKSNDIYALLDKNRKEVLVLKKIVINVNNGL